MDNLGEWLSSIAWPLVRKVFVAMGFGYLTFQGMDTALSAAIDSVRGAMQGLPGDVAMIVARAGFFDYMSITCGGFVGGLVWMQLKKLALTTGGQGT